MFESEYLSINTDFTDVTLVVSDDTYGYEVEDEEDDEDESYLESDTSYIFIDKMYPVTKVI